MRPHAVLPLLALALAGCLALPGAPGASQDDGTFRFIEVARDYRADPDGTAGVCGFPALPALDEANRTLTFVGEDWPGRDHAVLVLTVTWDRSRCGVAHAAWATSHRWSGTLASDNGTMEMRDDGALVVDGREVPRGGNVTSTASGVFPDGRAWTMTTRVHDHGAWPLTGVTRVDEQRRD